MKKSSIFVLVLLIIASILYACRVYDVNRPISLPIEYAFPMNSDVPIEDDYFDCIVENMEGYSVEINDAYLLSIDEFQTKFGGTDEYTRNTFEYILMVDTTFRNTSNSDGLNGGIDLAQYILQETSYISYIYREGFELVNDFDSLAFALRLDSEKDFIIPFLINTDTISIEQLETGSPKLVISLYPHKKTIELVVNATMK